MTKRNAPRRIRRESDDHPCFSQPEDPRVPVWRYMNFPKFVSFMQDGLFFSRVDRLGDAWEGALPSGTAPLFQAAAEAISAGGDPAWIEEMRGSWKRSYGTARTRTYASCWQAAERDVWWMWKVYCESEFGVAIRSTYDILDRVLPVDTRSGRHVMMGLVKYGDYDAADYVTDPSNVYSAVMSKRDAFQDEREVRVLCDAGDQGDGFFIDVKANRLLTSIIVSPLAPPWFRGTVERVVRAAKCSVAVEDSRLRRLPVDPF